MTTTRKRAPLKSLKIIQLQESAAYWAGKVLEGTCSGFALVGPGGIGKTHAIEQLFEKHKVQYDERGKNSHITPLALYHTLYEHRNEQVLLLDDIEHIYKQDVSVGLLRSALWGRKLPNGRRRRMVTYSTSRDLEIPDSFEYQGGIIIIGNRVPRKDDPIVQALLTRVPRVQFSVTKDDVYGFMRRVMVKKDGYSVWNGQQGKSIKIPRPECFQVINELERRGVLDLRVLEHALIAWMDFKTKPERLKRELDNVAQESELTGQPPKERAQAIFQELVQDDSLPESKKVELFEERTRGLRTGKAKGYDRATYFRWKQKWGNGENSPR